MDEALIERAVKSPGDACYRFVTNHERRSALSQSFDSQSKEISFGNHQRLVHIKLAHIDLEHNRIGRRMLSAAKSSPVDQ